MILAIDTTHDFGSLALFGAEGLREEMPLYSEDGFAHVLFGAVETLLARHSLRVEELAGFAAAQGPGSFTGVRVGMTAVKGLAEATGKPAYGVSNLAAMARLAGVQPVAPFFDARRGQVFGRLPDGDEVVVPYPEFLKLLPQEATLASFDFGPYPADGRKCVVLPRSIAGAVAELAWREYEAGRRPDPVLLDANYVRRSDAELHWREA
jgi:tRNA threonylcarbamoyladenosine biosynthesis protein TsaB